MSIANLLTENKYELYSKSLTAREELSTDGYLTFGKDALGVRYTDNTGSSAYLQVKNNDLTNLYWNNQKITGFLESNVYDLTGITTTSNLVGNDIPLNEIGTIQITMVCKGATTRIMREYNFCYEYDSGTDTMDIITTNPRVLKEAGSPITVDFVSNSGILNINITPTEEINVKASVLILDL